MKAKKLIVGAGAAIAMAVPGGIQAQVLFSDTLQSSDSSSWTINHSGSDYKAIFGFDYSTIGVTQDPWLSTGGSTALMFQVNQTAGVLQGVTVSPTGLGFTGNYLMTFDMFCSYNITTTGSTQIANYGVATSGTTANYSTVNDGMEFGNLLDNGSHTSYRGYLLNSSIGATPYVAGSQDYANSYYTGIFPSITGPTETIGSTTQTGTSVAGTVSYQWVQVAISVNNGYASESINGNMIVENVDISSLSGTNIFLGLYDSNNGSANTPDDFNFVLYNNLKVGAIPAPEPATLALFGLGGVGLLVISRRRNRK